jgi:manganese transport system ATP-binding protein
MAILESSPTETAVPVAAATAVRVEGVTLAFGAHRVLTGADLVLRSGTVTALIGPNGAGKSTLLSALAGLHPPATGRVRVLGQEPGAIRDRIAYVLQGTRVADHLPLTVRQAVTMGRYPSCGLLGRLRPTDRAAIDRAMERLAIADLARRQLLELSGGQRQRVFVAQGLAQEADVLLLDEPVTGLDAVSQQRILRVMAEERAAGRTVVASTHDLAEAAAADHLVLLSGRVVAAGSVEQVLTPEHLARAYGGRLVHLPGGGVVMDDGAHHHDHPPRAGAVGR